MSKASYRGFTTGFYFGKPSDKDQVYTDSSYIKTYDFIGMVLEYDEETGYAVIEQRNKFVKGDKVEFVRQSGGSFTEILNEMYDETGETVTEAPHAQQHIKIKLSQPVKPFDMMRREAKSNA